MEAARMGFGLKTFSNLHQVHLSLKTSLSRFPRPSLSLKPMKQDLFCLKATTTKNSTGDDLESSRPFAHYSPSMWGDYFLSLPVDESEFDEISREIESEMKPYVRNRLMSTHNTNKDKIRFIYLLVSLGISYHFETEVEMILNKAFEELDGLVTEEEDLETISIMFEVFRLYQHKMSCDIFERFKGEDGKFKDSLVGDVRGMLQLYQAAHFRTPSEGIMEEAKSFTRNQLMESLAESTTIPPHLSSLIRNALYRARYHNMEILVAREYISFYNQEESHDQTLLRFSKLNFNYCRLLYIQELKTLTKWWKDLDFASKLPYARDRIVETYFPALGLHFEPRYSLGRIIVTKIVMVVVVLDDTCDAYGSFSEVKTLIDYLQRWDLGAANDELPKKLRIVLESIMETMSEIEKEMKPRGRSASVQHTIDEIKSLGRAYLAMSKWVCEGHVPTFEEYMEVGLVTGGMDDFAAYSFIAMEDCAEKPLYEWFHSKPKMFQPLCAIYRMKNDIVSFEREMSRGEVANGVNCYMKDQGVTKDEAIEELSKMARDNYKIFMDEFLTTMDVPRPVLLRCLNIARLIDVFCKDSADEFTNPHGELKDLITSLFSHPIIV